MDADRCVSCGAIIPEGSHVCITCASGCTECGWENKENCKACMMGSKLKKLLEGEAERIKG